VDARDNRKSHRDLVQVSHLVMKKNKISNLLRNPSFYGILISPFIIFYWTLFGSETIGQDYLSGHFDEPLMHKFLTLKGIYPMWEMIRTGGIPYSGNPNAQIFYFPRWIYSLMPGFLSGHELIILLLRHFILFAVGQGFCYFTLRKLSSFNRLICFLVSFISVYNLSTLDAFRYGIYLDTYIFGMCLIFSMLIYLRTFESRYLLAVILCSESAICGSYYPGLPFIVLFGSLLAILFPIYDKISRKCLWQKYARLGVAAICGFLIAAPNWLPLTELLKVNFRRVAGTDISWANFAPMTPLTFFWNIAHPFSAEVHSGFGGSTFLPLLLGVVGLYFISNLKRNWPLLILIVFTPLYAVGRVSPLYRFFYYYVPGFGSIRAPGRIMIFLPLILIMCLIVTSVFSKIEFKKYFKISAGVNSLLLLMFIIEQLKYPSPGWKGRSLYETTPEEFFPDFWSQGHRVFWMGLGVLACFLFFRIADRGKSKRTWGALLVVTLVQTWMIVGHGTWHQPKRASQTLSELENRNYLPVYGAQSGIRGGADAAEGFATTPFVHFADAASPVMNCYYPFNSDQKDRGVLLPFYLSNNLICLNTDKEIMESLKAERTCTEKTVIHTYAVSSTVPLCKSSSGSSLTNKNLVELNKNNVVRSLTNNVVSFDIDSPNDAIFATRYPLVTDNWSGWLDGVEVPIINVNGAFVGMNVPKGKHNVKVVYLSALTLHSFELVFVGIALALIGASVLLLKKRKNAVVASIVTLIACFFGNSHLQKVISERARIEIQLNNNYSHLLEEQIQRWSE